MLDLMFAQEPPVRTLAFEDAKEWNVSPESRAGSLWAVLICKPIKWNGDMNTGDPAVWGPVPSTFMRGPVSHLREPT